MLSPLHPPDVEAEQTRRRIRFLTPPILVMASVLGLILRIAYAGRSGLWRDEALFLYVVKLPSVQAILDFLSQHESHPPFFYLLMRLWQSIAGTSEIAAFGPSILLGVALIPTMYWVGRQLHCSRVGLLAALLAAFSPILTDHAALVRPYSLLPLLGLLSVYFLYSSLQSGSKKSWGGYVLATLLMLWTHNWGFILLAGEWLTVLVAWPLFKRSPALILRGWLVAQGTILVAYSPWLPAFLHQARSAGHAAHPIASMTEVLNLLGMVVTAIPAATPAVLGLGMLIAAISFISQDQARTETLTTNQRATLVFFFWLPLVAYFVAVLLSPRTDLLQPRCLTTLVPCFILAVAIVLVRVSKARGGWLLLGLVCGFNVYATVSQLDSPKSNARELAMAMSEQVQPRDLIVISPMWVAPSFNYYFSKTNQQINFPHIGRMGAVPWDNLADRMADPSAYRQTRDFIRLAHENNRRVWYVMEASMVRPTSHGEDEIAGAKAAHQWPAIGVMRSNQLQEDLAGLYGPSTKKMEPGDDARALERLVAFLYEPRNVSFPFAK